MDDTPSIDTDHFSLEDRFRLAVDDTWRCLGDVGVSPGDTSVPAPLCNAAIQSCAEHWALDDWEVTVLVVRLSAAIIAAVR